MKILSAPMMVLSCMLVACGGDGPAGADSNSLSRSEALDLATAYFATLEGSSAQTVSRPTRLAVLADTTIHPGDGTLPCEQGGVLALAWQDTVIFDQVGPTMRINVGGTHTPSGCVFRAGSTSVTMNGAPHFIFASHSVIIAGMPQPIVETLRGDFSWTARDGRSGTCAVQYQRTITPSTGRDVRQGTICTHTFTALAL